MTKEEIDSLRIDAIKKKLKENAMRCKFCGEEVTVYNHFWNIETCVKCHKAGRDR